MKFIHIHSSLSTELGKIPYLILGTGGSERMSLDFSKLEDDPQHITPSVALSKGALYEVLEGKALYVDRSEDSIRLESDLEELVIECNHHGDTRIYRVWLAELALGWNMLSRTDAVDFPKA